MMSNLMPYSKDAWKAALPQKRKVKAWNAVFGGIGEIKGGSTNLLERTESRVEVFHLTDRPGVVLVQKVINTQNLAEGRSENYVNLHNAAMYSIEYDD